MKNNKKYILVVALICIAAYGGFIYGGNQRQKALDQYFQLLAFSSWAIEVKSNVQLLDLIEAKKYKDAENLLEKFLDVRLASISLYDKYSAQHPDQNIFSAIDIARKHREQKADYKINPKLEPDVVRALKISKPEK